jgi:DNA-binding NtrC family response regulator
MCLPPFPSSNEVFLMTAAIAPTTFSPSNPISFPTLLNLLIADGDRFVREACREAAMALGCNTSASQSAEQTLRLIDSQPIDVVLLDSNLPNTGRLDLLREIKHRRPDVEVIVVCGNAIVHSAVQSMKDGAYDFLAKPFGLQELKLLLERVAAHLKRKVESRRLNEKMKSDKGFGNIIGRAPEMDKLYRIIGKAAQSAHPVLILGESGTGKEMVARAIHRSGPFRDKPFVPVDCGSLVPTLVESELFGYVKGAFTGAVQSKSGLLAIAEGGTVFLDEVGELSVELQAKLLRALQEKEIRPVGGTKQVPINVRILAATNRDLEQAVGQGRFRRDLYFRLNVLSLRIPPLRERRDDIPLLATSFVERVSRASRVTHTLSDDAIKALMAYGWPGNVRELENCIERCCAMNSGPVIHTADLPSSITTTSTDLVNAAPTGSIGRISDLERQAILGAIEQLHGDKLTAAKLLGIGKTTLYRKLKEYGENAVVVQR